MLACKKTNRCYNLQVQPRRIVVDLDAEVQLPAYNNRPCTNNHVPTCMALMCIEHVIFYFRILQSPHTSWLVYLHLERVLFRICHDDNVEANNKLN